VGFGSYLTRIKRLLEQDKPENLEKLAGFFGAQQPVMATVLGEAKADAVVRMLSGIAQTQKANQEEMSLSVTEQLNIITHIQEILHIQRQYITGKETQERKPVNLRNIINDSLAMLFSSIDKSAIAISLEIPAELPLLKGDRTKLMQVMLTIFKNSIEAIDTEAPEKAITLKAYQQNGELAIQFRDSGAGFDEATAGRLFERGFTTKFSGAGLGLYNCREIVESHEGTMAITSEGPGKGALATIIFRLPSGNEVLRRA
jgi:signal transduction histidine kinase